MISPLDEDSISDWSTDSCEWSDDELGAELDNATPPLSLGSVALETSTQEVVRCVCEAEEENDFMIQVSCFGGLPDSSPDLPPIHIIESEINSWWQSTSLSIILNQSHLSNRTKLKV